MCLTYLIGMPTQGEAVSSDVYQDQLTSLEGSQDRGMELSDLHADTAMENGI